MKLENSMTFQVFHEPYKPTMFKNLFLQVQFVAVSASEMYIKLDCLKTLYIHLRPVVYIFSLMLSSVL